MKPNPDPDPEDTRRIEISCLRAIAIVLIILVVLLAYLMFTPIQPTIIHTRPILVISELIRFASRFDELGRWLRHTVSDWIRRQAIAGREQPSHEYITESRELGYEFHRTAMTMHDTAMSMRVLCDHAMLAHVISWKLEAQLVSTGLHWSAGNITAILNRFIDVCLLIRCVPTHANSSCVQVTQHTMLEHTIKAWQTQMLMEGISAFVYEQAETEQTIGLLTLPYHAPSLEDDYHHSIQIVELLVHRLQVLANGPELNASAPPHVAPTFCERS